MFPKNFRGKIIDVYQWHWLEESGQWLENVDRTHLVLSRGKSVLQNKGTNEDPGKRNVTLTFNRNIRRGLLLEDQGLL